MTTLTPGIGARGTILTRMIKPLQVSNANDPKHRSEVIIDRWFANKKGTVYYEFRYENEDATSTKLHGAARFVKITEEGPPTHFFTGQAPQEENAKQEPKRSWGKSLARKMLYEDIRNGDVPLEKNNDGMTDMDVYTYRPETCAYSWENFPARLKRIRDIISINNKRAVADQDAFDNFVANNPVSYYSHKGYKQWQGSKAQRQAAKDIKRKSFAGRGKYRKLYNKRAVYYEAYPYEFFKDKLRQELKTAQYHHTLRERGKAYGNPKQWPKSKTT